MNVADSQRVGSSLEHLGYALTDTIEEADVIVLNTCVVRQSAEDKVTVVAAGVTLYEALKAADTLKNAGIGITVIDAYSVKPLAKDVIRSAAQKTRNVIVTVEDHYPEGGLGDAVAGELSMDGIKVHKLAVYELPHSGKPEELVAKYKIDAAAIVETVKKLASA